MLQIFRVSILFLGLFFNSSLAAKSVHNEQTWGIAAMYRTASIPFYTANDDSTVSSFVPMMFFKNEHLYIDGIEGGLYLYGKENSDWQINAISRLRFVDIPKSVQNAFEGDRVDFGGQVRYKFNENWRAEAEIMSDDEFQFHANTRLAASYEFADWEVESSFTIRYKDADFNSNYYSFSNVTGEKIGSGIDAKLGMKTRYHVVSNLYLLAGASITMLENEAYHSLAVEDRYQSEFFVGVGFFNDQKKTYKSELVNRPFLRIAQGWATPSNFSEILTFNSEKDEFNNKLTSFFYGHPLTDELFGAPWHFYITSGLVHHWSSNVQPASSELVVAIKAYYTFDFPTKWRFGLAEGISYINKLTYIEETEMKHKGYTPSNLLNYIDFSLDLNLGDLLKQKDWENIWLGYSLHHRSAIFESASQFGRIKGGSNYNTIYLQFDF